MVTWIADSISPSFRLYTIKDGLCNDFINEIAIDEKDQVWCAKGFLFIHMLKIHLLIIMQKVDFWIMRFEVYHTQGIGSL